MTRRADTGAGDDTATRCHDRQRVLLVHNRATTFVTADLALLAEFSQVTEFAYTTMWISPARVWRAVRGSDVVFSWFVSWHSVLPFLFAKLLRKPTIAVVGGYDVARVDSIAYGLQRIPVVRGVTRWMLRGVTRCLPFSEAARVDAMDNANVPSDKITVIPLGVEDFAPGLNISERERLALSVGDVTASNLMRKGLEVFVKAAAYLPDVQFVLVGEWRDAAIDRLRSIGAPNVSFTGRIAADDLHAYYLRSSVYVQASAHEGFGLAVAEAMLGGCIPVVTRAGSLPEVVGEAGLYVVNATASELADQIRLALRSDTGSRIAARARICTRFSQQRRATLLRSELQSLTSPSTADC